MNLLNINDFRLSKFLFASYIYITLNFLFNFDDHALNNKMYIMDRSINIMKHVHVIEKKSKSKDEF